MDAEIKDPSVENPELKGSPFRAWNRSEYSLACFAYSQGFRLLLISTFPVCSPSSVLAVLVNWCFEPSQPQRNKYIRAENKLQSVRAENKLQSLSKLFISQLIML